MKQPSQILGLTVLLLAGSLLLGVGTAQTASMSIGGPGPFVLNDDASLVADVNCTAVTAADCITFAADGITLELNGFTVSGPESSRFPEVAPCDGLGIGGFGTDGIDTAGFHGANIKGPGKVEKFSVGIHINASNDSKVTGVVVIRNCLTGILVDGPSHDVEVKGNIALRTADRLSPSPASPSGGISIAGTNIKVDGNEVQHNGASVEDFGILVSSGIGNLIRRNSVNANSGTGIQLKFQTSDTTVDENIVLDTGPYPGGVDIADESFLPGPPGGPPIPLNTVTTRNVCETMTGVVRVCASSPTPGFAVKHSVD